MAGVVFHLKAKDEVTFPGKAATKEQLFDAVITYLSKLSASDRDTQRVLRKFDGWKANDNAKTLTSGEFTMAVSHYQTYEPPGSRGWHLS